MYEFQITFFEEQGLQREIEKAISIEYCLQHAGLLCYIGDRPFLKKNEDYIPLAISHSRGVHIIGQGEIGIDIESKKREVKIKPEWIPKSLNKLSNLEIFTLGESLIKLNLYNFAQLIGKVELDKYEENEEVPSLGLSQKKLKIKVGHRLVTSYFFSIDHFLCCLSLKH